MYWTHAHWFRVRDARNIIISLAQRPSQSLALSKRFGASSCSRNAIIWFNIITAQRTDDITTTLSHRMWVVRSPADVKRWAHTTCTHEWRARIHISICRATPSSIEHQVHLFVCLPQGIEIAGKKKMKKIQIAEKMLVFIRLERIGKQVINDIWMGIQMCVCTNIVARFHRFIEFTRILFILIATDCSMRDNSTGVGLVGIYKLSWYKLCVWIALIVSVVAVNGSSFK